MPIYSDVDTDSTVCICDCCSAEQRTAKANGVVPADWGTGQLWIDISLSDIKNMPLCFCATCKERFVYLQSQSAKVLLPLAPSLDPTPDT